MTSNPLTEFIHPDDLEESLSIFKKFQQTGELGFDNQYFINRYRTKYGFYKSIVWESILETDDEYYMMEARTED